MSIVFEALKKARGKQIEQLFELSTKGVDAQIAKHNSRVATNIDQQPPPQNPANGSAQQVEVTEKPPEVVEKRTKSFFNPLPANQGAANIAAPIAIELPVPKPVFREEEPINRPVPNELKIAQPAMAINKRGQVQSVVINNKHPQITLRADRGQLVTLREDAKVNSQFALLRARIIAAAKKYDLQTIAVTSAVDGEGKTFIATNLALTLAAESERGVIIVDGYLRKPSLNRAMGIQEMPGLADFLQSDRTDIDSIIIDTDKRLACIPAGRVPHSPISLLDSAKMQSLMAELRRRYDYVIVDAPPTVPLADAESIAALTDGLILVIKAAQTPLPVVQRAVKLLSKHKIIGTVLNSVQVDASYRYHQ